MNSLWHIPKLKYLQSSRCGISETNRGSTVYLGILLFLVADIFLFR